MSKTRNVLGKGLSALLPDVRNDRGMEQDSGNGLHELGPRRPGDGGLPREALIRGIEIARIAPNPLQPRKDFPMETLAQLTESIREHGVIQAVTVRKAGADLYELISGERRIRASIEAGLTEIPAFIIEADSDRKMLELAIVENVQRVQLNPIDEAEAYYRLMEDCGLTQDDVADKISKDRTTVANFIRLLKLPEPIKDSLRAGHLGLGHAKAVLMNPDPAAQVRLWEEAVAQHYSVRKLEELSRPAPVAAGEHRVAASTGTASSGQETSNSEAISAGAISGVEQGGAEAIGMVENGPLPSSPAPGPIPPEDSPVESSRIESNRVESAPGSRPDSLPPVRETRKPSRPETIADTSAELRSIEGVFQQILGTQVKVRLKPDNTGEVGIQFYSFDDLDRIRELFAAIPLT